jgi:hypothetical protein
MKKVGKKGEIISVIVKKKGIFFISQEQYKASHKNTKDLNKWFNAVTQIYF